VDGVHVEREANMPPCSRCGRDAAMRTRVPAGEGVDLELCLTCDAGQGAAGRVVEQFRLPEAQRSVDVMAEAIKEWIYEAMAAKGWRQAGRVEPPREGLLGDATSAAVAARAGGAQRGQWN
jgi:hypothetical protein